MHYDVEAFVAGFVDSLILVLGNFWVTNISIELLKFGRLYQFQVENVEDIGISGALTSFFFFSLLEIYVEITERFMSIILEYTLVYLFLRIETKRSCDA